MLTAQAQAAQPTRIAPSKVFIVDDHEIVRRGVRDLLQDQSDFVVCGEAENEREARRKFNASGCNIALVDLSLGDANGFDLIRWMHQEQPDLPILVLSMHDEMLYAERVLRAGARGYISKDRPAAEVVAAVRAVLRGDTVLSPSVTNRLIERTVQGGAGGKTGVDSLSDRELEVFELIGAGMSTREIAKRLCRSVKTIETHRENIKHKLSIDSAAELSRFAVAWYETAS